MFMIMSMEFLKRYIPPTLTEWPAWLRVWVLHTRAACAILRFHYTFADLLQLEQLIIESELAIQSHPPYAGMWIPKAHWILHVAHDIYRWGPSRLLWVFLKEMKLAAFKRGCKRGNFQNPVKCSAEFWCEQSDYQLQQASFSRDACQEPCVFVSGKAEALAADSEPLRMMLRERAVTADASIAFLSSVTFHGVTMRRSECVLVQRSLYVVKRLITCNQMYFLWARLLCAQLCTDQYGSWVAHIDDVASSYRLMSLNNGSDVTCVYTIPTGVPGVVTVIVKM